MLYKEWLSMREKLYFWMAIYTGLVVLQLMLWKDTSTGGHLSIPVTGTMMIYDSTFSLFKVWLNPIMVVTGFAALFGWVDIVSDEVDKGTLSFLLTKPISRTRIYTTKILLNIAGVFLTFGLSSGVIFIVDRFQPYPIDPWEALGFSLLILAASVTLICLGGLISVFTRNALKTLALTVGILVGLYIFGFQAFLYVISLFGEELNSILILLMPNISVEIILALGIVGIIGLICGLFWAGLFAFKRKEF